MAAPAAPDDGGGSSGLFEGIRFFLLQRLPCRTALQEDVRQHGGSVVKLETQATYIIADHVRADAPNASISWKFITESIKAERLLDVNQYVISSMTGAARPAGSSVVPSKKTRNEYTEAESKALRDYVEKRLKEDTILGPSGCVVYQEFQQVNPRHTWQSYQAHYKKNWLPTALQRAGIATRAQLVHMRPEPGPSIDVAADLIDGQLPGESIPEPEETPADQGDGDDTSDGASKRSRVPFTREEDADFQTYVLSKPEDARSGNVIYLDYALTHSTHSWQSWRDHWVKVLSKRVDPDGPQLPSRVRTGYSEEDDLALWDFLAEQRFASASGSSVYMEFAKTHDRHTWQSWRDRYVRHLKKNPPAKRKDGPQPAASAQPVQAPRRTVAQILQDLAAKPAVQKQTQPNRAATALAAAVVRKAPQHAASPINRPTVDTAAESDRVKAVPSESKGKNVLQDPTLSDEHEELVAAVLARGPRDGRGHAWTQVEVGHLVVNMPALQDKIDNVAELDPWEEWAREMMAKTANEWEVLYYDHVIPEQHKQRDRLRKQRKSLQTPVLPVVSREGSSQKRKAAAVLLDSGVKRQMIEAEHDAASTHSSLRSDSLQLQSSHVRRDWLFDRAAQRRRAQESIRGTPSASQTRGHRLTMANLAAQTASLRSQPSHVEAFMEQDEEYEAAQQAQTAENNSQAQASLPSPAASPVNESASQVPLLPTTLPDSYEQEKGTTNRDDLQLVGESTPIPLPPTKVSPSVETGIPTPAADVYEESSPSRYVLTSQASYELDLSIPSPYMPPQETTHAAQRREQSTLSSTVTHPSGLRLSTISSPPGSHISIPADLNQGLPSSPPEISRNAFADDESEASMANKQQLQILDTQAVMDTETQLPGFSLENPDFDLPSEPKSEIRSSPPPAPKSRLDHALAVWNSQVPSQSPQQQHVSQAESSQGSQSQEFDAYHSKWVEEGWSNADIYDTLWVCSSRAMLADRVLSARFAGHTFDEHGTWRWTREEDEILLGSDASAKLALESKHGTEQYRVRLLFLSDMMNDAES